MSSLRKINLITSPTKWTPNTRRTNVRIANAHGNSLQKLKRSRARSRAARRTMCPCVLSCPCCEENYVSVLRGELCVALRAVCPCVDMWAAGTRTAAGEELHGARAQFGAMWPQPGRSGGVRGVLPLRAPGSLRVGSAGTVSADTKGPAIWIAKCCRFTGLPSATAAADGYSYARCRVALSSVTTTTGAIKKGGVPLSCDLNAQIHELARLWEGHACTLLSSEAGAISYIYKYAIKRRDHATRVLWSEEGENG